MAANDERDVEKVRESNDIAWIKEWRDKSDPMSPSKAIPYKKSGDA